jgi:hypothetical protein
VGLPSVAVYGMPVKTSDEDEDAFLLSLTPELTDVQFIDDHLLATSMKTYIFN